MADLPAPVGSTATTLRPAAAALIASSWPGRSCWNPSRSRARRRIESAVGSVVAIVGLLGRFVEQPHEEKDPPQSGLWDETKRRRSDSDPRLLPVKIDIGVAVWNLLQVNGISI